MATKPEVLIERWLPIEIIGAESLRDASAAQKPPLNRLHVWWARRPLTTCRAAILASVLPAWRADWPKHLADRFPTQDAYRAWFLRACGIFGDPVKGRKLIQWANERKIKLTAPPYTHKRAFTVSPDADTLAAIGDLLEHTWGTRQVSVLDPFAGGGSIPFEAMRYGFETFANELNPVATVILKATLEYPARFGPGLADDIKKYGKMLADRVRERLKSFFPVQEGESIHAYIWARTVRCPYTGKPIPLSPNWWLQKGTDPVAVRPIFDPALPEARFEIVRGKAACERVKPDLGTVRRGNAVSPWANGQAVDGDYIKAEAQAGRMGQQLYTLAIKQRGGVSYRSPGPPDVQAARRADTEHAALFPSWEAGGLIPSEPRCEGRADWSARIYGMPTWASTFSPRQLLSQIAFVEALRGMRGTLSKELGRERAAAIITYLAVAQDKAADYNAILSTWETARQIVKHVFKRHDFAFSWSFAEFDASRNLFPWVIEQVIDAFSGIAALLAPAAIGTPYGALPGVSGIYQGTASDIPRLADGQIASIVTDPPYYDNVMYAECSDFFYVWMKRTLGDVYPELFREELTNKDDEAVANEARFRDMGKKRKELALADYERKMLAAFREMHRVLRDDGVLTVMFTHKKVEAWDTLATSLIGAGFVIHSSWPVHTESEHSLHQAKKNAAQSTILLSCRKREPRSEPVWWDDLKATVRRTAREKAAEFLAQGIRGVDLYIATFGPTLAIISEHWPVLTSEVDERTGQPKPLRPEVALDVAREEVVALRRQGLLLGRTVQFDPATDWYLMAWDAFKAAEFPADEARKLALSLGLDMERDVVASKRLVAKKASTVVLQEPLQRHKRGMVDADRTAFDCWVDAAHTAMMVYQEDGAAPCKRFLDAAGLRQDSTFKACLQAMLNAIPRTKARGTFVRKEAEVLDAMRLAFFDDLTLPVEDEPVLELTQTDFGFEHEDGDTLGLEPADENEGSDE